jgi:hypothetical protein
MKGVVFAAVGRDTSFMAVPLRRLRGEADELVVFSLQSVPPQISDDIAQSGEEPPDGEPYEKVDTRRYAPPDEDLEEAQILLKEEIDRVCTALGVSSTIVGVPANSDFENALRVMQQRLRDYEKGYVRQFFLGDTTLSVNVAAVTACYLEGVPLFVADAASDGIVPIPVIRMRYDTAGLSAHDMRALRVLAELGEPPTIGTLAGLLRRKKSTLSERITRMEQFGVVRRIDGVNGRETRVEMLPQGRVLLRASEVRP